MYSLVGQPTGTVPVYPPPYYIAGIHTKGYNTKGRVIKGLLTNAESLSKTNHGGLMYSLVGQGARTGYNTDNTLLDSMTIAFLGIYIVCI